MTSPNKYNLRPDPLFCPVCGRKLEQRAGIDYVWLRCPKRSFWSDARHYDEPTDERLSPPKPPILFDPYTGRAIVEKVGPC